jgi:death-on-curing protein
VAAHGVRDEAALESALSQAEATFGGKPLHPSLEEQAAAYLFHLCQAHPFVDGNKRVALAATDVFLRLNGRRLTLTDDEAYDLTMSVARGEIGKDDIAAVVRASLEPT